MKYLAYAIGIALLLFVGAVAWAMNPPIGAAVCFVNFKGTTYDQAVEFRDALLREDMDASLDGQPGGPRRAPVITVDGGFWDSASGLEDDIGPALAEIGGGEIQTCFDRSLGD